MLVDQASLLDGAALDAFSVEQDGLGSAEIDVSRGQVAQALVAAVMIVVVDESLDFCFEIAWQVVVLEQDAVLQSLVPALDLALCLAEAGSTVRVRLIGGATRAPDLVIIGSHCVGLDAVLDMLAEQGIRARTLAVGSLGGLAAAKRGECDLAPAHLLDPTTGSYNTPFLAPGLVLKSGWRRSQGVVFRPGDAGFEGLDGREAVRRAALDPDCLLVNRNAGSGTRILLDGLLAGMRPSGYANQPKSHNAVAAAVAQSRADWGVAIETVARDYGLGFLPLADEHYDFFVPESALPRVPMKAFFEALGSPVVHARLAGLGFHCSHPPS